MTDESTEEDNLIEVEVEQDLSFTAGRTSTDAFSGFNQHGIRENRNDSGDLQSVDVVYEAMQPGPPEDRNGVRITEDFLQSVADKEYSQQEPYMLGHSEKPLDEVGKMKQVWYSDTANKLMVMNRVFNTGAATHDEVISRLTHNPPTMTDGSVGLGSNYEAVVNGDEEPELVDGKIREFSTVPFPGGYDNGGVGLPSADFADAVLEMSEDGDELDEVYSDWSDAVNMTASQLDSWSDHPCADTASQDPAKVRKRNMRLLEKNKSDWTSDDVDDAKRTISFIERMRGQKPDSPAEGGKGTCPSEWAVSLLNWAYNPFDGMPDGTPDPEESSSNVETITFDSHMEEKSKVYSMWEEMTNMTEEQMEMWEDHPCSDEGVDVSEEHRDNFMMLMGQPVDGWGMEEMQIANRVVAYISDSMDQDPDNPMNGGPGTCPSRWAVNLLNRGVNPFDSFPSGNPEFSDAVEVINFDDEAHVNSSSENPDLATTKTIKF